MKHLLKTLVPVGFLCALALLFLTPSTAQAQGTGSTGTTSTGGMGGGADLGLCAEGVGGEHERDYARLLYVEPECGRASVYFGEDFADG